MGMRRRSGSGASGSTAAPRSPGSRATGYFRLQKLGQSLSMVLPVEARPMAMREDERGPSTLAEGNYARLVYHLGLRVPMLILTLDLSDARGHILASSDGGVVARHGNATSRHSNSFEISRRSG